MRVRTLGTGSSDGWPGPWCSCSSSAWPAQVEALRECGAVVPTTAVHAVHLGHDNPPDLDDLLAGWGASAPRDGDVLEAGR